MSISSKWLVKYEKYENLEMPNKGEFSSNAVPRRER